MIIIIILTFYTKDLYGIGDAVKIPLSPDLYITVGLEAFMVMMKWYKNINNNTIIIHSGVAVIIQCQKTTPSIIWELVVKNWAVDCVPL